MKGAGHSTGWHYTEKQWFWRGSRFCGRLWGRGAWKYECWCGLWRKTHRLLQLLVGCKILTSLEVCIRTFDEFSWCAIKAYGSLVLLYGEPEVGVTLFLVLIYPLIQGDLLDGVGFAE